ncbi:MAG: hypothetical protein B7Y26_02140 [Hydrogenophilales bacterium 16-64-46]|nr:MAG: hypothetical protein B7Z32_01840 [Hydrogenophilales bacterium 12-64-13]OYZ06626.1 MAG: hypothetical protein B7Y26_02140 [Hydrogenophilales bacterium 16-64-46]OZA39334.1 MAG: hypothetical protein B7X87_03245 [Hydrogenophilales bacterium 17-64-34]HQS98896.1 PhnD/SsuA/transferrin family substrate-binding protein [Thiobacillus sp.]
MHLPLVASLAACLLMFAVPIRAASPLVVGVLPYQGARALIAEHRDLSDYLRSALNRPVQIVTARNAQVFGQRLLAGDYDLALAPAHFARLAEREAGWQVLAEHRPDTPLYLLTAASTPASRQPRAGDTVAVPDRAMLLTLAAQRWLDSHFALDPRDYHLLDAGSHSAALQAVLDGRADYAVSALAAMNLVRPGNIRRIRIAHEIGKVPLLVYIARPTLPAATVARLRAALLDFPVPAPLRVVASDQHSLAAVDVYLPATRQLLRDSLPTKSQELADVR